MRQYLLSIPIILLLLVGSASAQTVNFSLRSCFKTIVSEEKG